MDLELATIQDIFNELEKRLNGFVLVTIQDDKVNNSCTRTRGYFSGGVPLAIGLCEQAKANFLNGTWNHPPKEESDES